MDSEYPEDNETFDDGLVPCSEDGSPGYDPFTPPTPVNSKRFDFKMHAGGTASRAPVSCP